MIFGLILIPSCLDNSLAALSVQKVNRTQEQKKKKFFKKFLLNQNLWNPNVLFLTRIILYAIVLRLFYFYQKTLKYQNEEEARVAVH